MFATATPVSHLPTTAAISSSCPPLVGRAGLAPFIRTYNVGGTETLSPPSLFDGSLDFTTLPLLFRDSRSPVSYCAARLAGPGFL